MGYRTAQRIQPCNGGLHGLLVGEHIAEYGPIRRNYLPELPEIRIAEPVVGSWRHAGFRFFLFIQSRVVSDKLRHENVPPVLLILFFQTRPDDVADRDFKRIKELV